MTAGHLSAIAAQLRRMANATTDAAARWSTASRQLDALSSQIPLAWDAPDGRRVGSHVAASARLAAQAPLALSEASSALRHTAIVADELSSVVRRLDRQEDDVRARLRTALAAATESHTPTGFMPGAASHDSPGADDRRVPTAAATDDLERQLRRIERTRAEIAEQWMTQCRQLAVTASNCTAALNRSGLGTDRESPMPPTLTGGPMWINRAFPHAGLDLPLVRFAPMPSSTAVGDGAGMFRFLWDWSAAVAVSGALGGVLASLGPIGTWLAAPPSRPFADPLQRATPGASRHPNHAPNNPDHFTSPAGVRTGVTTSEVATAGVAPEVDLTDIQALDRRNRQILERSLASLSDRIAQLDARAIPAGVDRRSGLVAERARLEEATRATTAIAAALDDHGTPERPSLLLEFHPDAPDRVVIALGDPSHADRIDITVPGTGSDAPTVATYLSAENDLAQRESADPHRLGATAVATIVFLNYPAPSGVVAARRTEAAVAGGAALADRLVALRQANPRARITVTGHSYGSTVAGAALRDERVDVDAAVMLSSPGVLAASADDLDGTTCVVAMTAASDVIGPVASSRATARHGPDPTNPYFGATVVTTRPGWSLWHGYEGYAAHDQAADAILAARRGEVACRP